MRGFINLSIASMISQILEKYSLEVGYLVPENTSVIELKNFSFPHISFANFHCELVGKQAYPVLRIANLLNTSSYKMATSNIL